MQWLASADKRAVGTLIQDMVDYDYSWVCFFRRRDCYAFVDAACSIPTPTAARRALEQRMADNKNLGPTGNLREAVLEHGEAIAAIAAALGPIEPRCAPARKEDR